MPVSQPLPGWGLPFLLGGDQVNGMQSSDTAKLARVLGLLGSEHAGERAAAALAAHRLVKRLGLSWQEILMPRREAVRTSSHLHRAIPPPHEIVSAVESRLRQAQRENDELRRQNAQLRRRLEAAHQFQRASEQDE